MSCLLQDLHESDEIAQIEGQIRGRHPQHPLPQHHKLNGAFRRFKPQCLTLRRMVREAVALSYGIAIGKLPAAGGAVCEGEAAKFLLSHELPRDVDCRVAVDPYFRHGIPEYLLDFSTNNTHRLCVHLRHLWFTH